MWPRLGVGIRHSALGTWLLALEELQVVGAAEKWEHKLGQPSWMGRVVRLHCVSLPRNSCAIFCGKPSSPRPVLHREKIWGAKNMGLPFGSHAFFGRT